MKSMLQLLFVVLSISSTSAFAKNLTAITSSETQVLHFLTDLKTVSLGEFSARTIVLSSFAEPAQTIYLLMSRETNFSSEQENTALYDLTAGLESGYFFKSLEKVSNQKIRITLKRGNQLKVLNVTVNGLDASI